MSDIDDPEDGFDAGDPIHERLANIVARLRYVIDRGMIAGEFRDRLERVVDDLRIAREEVKP